MKDIIVVKKRIKEEQWVRLSAATLAGESHIHPGCTWTPWTILLCLFLALKNTLTLLGKRKMARFKGTCPGTAVIGSREITMGALQMGRREGWAELQKNKGRVNEQIPIPVHQCVLQAGTGHRNNSIARGEWGGDIYSHWPPTANVIACQSGTGEWHILLVFICSQGVH